MIYSYQGHNAGAFTGEKLDETPGIQKQDLNIIDVEEVKEPLLLEDKPKEFENPS